MDDMMGDLLEAANTHCSIVYGELMEGLEGVDNIRAFAAEDYEETIRIVTRYLKNSF